MKDCSRELETHRWRIKIREKITLEELRRLQRVKPFDSDYLLGLEFEDDKGRRVKTVEVFAEADNAMECAKITLDGLINDKNRLEILEIPSFVVIVEILD